jgi:hypothetical protein
MNIISKNEKSLIFPKLTYIKELIAFLILLMISSLLLLGMKLIFPDNLVIYIQKDKADFIQVFFPKDGYFSEKYSSRSEFSGKQTAGIKIPLPLRPYDYVRVDPANELGNIVIKKIEFKYLFSTTTYTPIDLLPLIKPIQMIDKLEVTPAGLLIHSTGNDPAFELKFKSPSILSQGIIFCLISFLLTIALFILARKLLSREITIAEQRLSLLVIPFLMSLGVAALFYPGFMSYDTLHALRSARSGVTDSMWPPMVSYVWRAVDLVSTNPSAMHFSQLFLLLFSIFFIIFAFTKKIKYATAFLLIYLAIPTVLGTAAVIWKDVLMAAFFLSGFAVIVFMTHVKNKWLFIILSVFATFLIFLGVCSRHNGITGAVPLLFYLALIICSRVLKSPSSKWLAVFFLGSTLTCSVFITKVQLDHYSVPSFVKLNTGNDLFILGVRVLDVAGASLCAGTNLFGDVAPNLSLNEIMSGYDPRHVNLSKDLLSKVVIDSKINKVWLSVAIQHPVCFFSHKFHLTKYMIGANKGVPFLITAPSVDQNEFGYFLPDSPIRDLAVTYIINASELPFLKTWFIYLLSIISLIYLISTRTLTVGHSVIFLSAIFYFGGLVIFGNAGDARLLFYTTTALLMLVFISIFEPKKSFDENNIFSN